MKTAFLVVMAFIGVQAQAQTTSAPPGTAQTPPASLARPGVSYPAIPSGTNPIGPNSLSADLAEQLVNLQADVEQILPLLAAFNDSFEFAAGNGGGVVPVAFPALGGSPNAGVNLATNLATSFAVNFGQNLATPTGIRVVNVPAPPPALIVPAGTNGFAVFPLTRETVGAMLLLQKDMQRLLPILSAVNSGNNPPQ